MFLHAPSARSGDIMMLWRGSAAAHISPRSRYSLRQRCSFAAMPVDTMPAFMRPLSRASMPVIFDTSPF